MFNLGTGSEVSVGELAERVLRILGRDLPIVQEDQRLRPEKSEVMRLLSDNSRAREHLGWQPQVGLDEGLGQAIDWIRGHLGFFSPGQYQR